MRVNTRYISSTRGTSSESAAGLLICFASFRFVPRIAKRFDAASRLLPEFLKADRNLLQTLQGEVQGEQERLAGMYPKLMNTCTALQGTLDMFYVQRLMPFDFSMRELK